jgi:hypothetical protein
MTNPPDFRKLLEAAPKGPIAFRYHRPDGELFIGMHFDECPGDMSRSYIEGHGVLEKDEDNEAFAALIVAAVNALPEHLARIAELEAENAILKRLAPEYFRWTGGPDQTEDPEWACDKLKYGGAHFENIGTPQVRLVVYDDQDRRWVAERGDYIVKDRNGLWVLPALSGGKP